MTWTQAKMLLIYFPIYLWKVTKKHAILQKLSITFPEWSLQEQNGYFIWMTNDSTDDIYTGYM